MFRLSEERSQSANGRSGDLADASGTTTNKNEENLKIVSNCIQNGTSFFPDGQRGREKER